MAGRTTNPDGTPADFAIPKRDPSQAYLEAVDARIQAMDQRLCDRLDTLTATVDRLAVQVAQFNQGLKELKDISRQILSAIEADREIAKMQSANVQQLSNNVQQMVALAAQQQQTINTLITKLAA